MNTHHASGLPCLNPIAHPFFEPPRANASSLVAVHDASRVHHPVIRHELHPPVSHFVIRLEPTTPVAAVQPVNLLNATRVIAEPAPINPLYVHPHEAQAQVEPERVVILTSHAPTPAPEPVVDRLSVDDLVASLAELAEEEPSDALMEEVAEMLTAPSVAPESTAPTTIDELLDTVPSLVAPSSSHPTPTTHRRERRSLPAGWTKSLAVFLGLSFITVAPIHAVTSIQQAKDAEGTILAQGQAALSLLKNGASATTQQAYADASAQFNRAHGSFRAAQATLSKAKSHLVGVADLLPSTREQTKTAAHLLTAGESAARAAATLAEGLQRVSDRTTQSPAAALGLFDVFAEQALPDLWNADQALSRVSMNALPTDMRSQVRSVQTLVAQSAASLQQVHDHLPALQGLLGHGTRQRYLLLFQNNTELRPTGGFWGSMAEVDVLDGKIVAFRLPGGGTYDVQGQLRQNISAPGPLQLLRARWELQDANWFPDFPTSAKAAMWFYEQSGEPSVDGVLTLNASLVSQLIDATGPIHLANYGLTLDGENFLFQTQRQVELGYDKVANQPKAILGDMAPILLDRLLQAKEDTLLQVADIVTSGLASGDVQVYHSDPSIQSALEDLGWDGGLTQTTGDYLLVSHANIGGGKTDGLIDDEILVDSRLRPDGRIENTVTVHRTHHGLATGTFSGHNNVSYTRLYVPRGSTLLAVSGFERPASDLFESTQGLNLSSPWSKMEEGSTDPETGAFVGSGFGKTVFGDWIQTRPGQDSTLTFRYLLPADILDERPQTALVRAASWLGWPQTVAHSMVIQSQPGVSHRTVNYHFESGDALTPLWSNGDALTDMQLDTNLTAFFGMMFERPYETR